MSVAVVHHRRWEIITHSDVYLDDFNPISPVIDLMCLTREFEYSGASVRNFHVEFIVPLSDVMVMEFLLYIRVGYTRVVKITPL